MARKTSRIRRTFTPQFKKDAVALVAAGRGVNEVAHDLGIARSLPQRWKTQLAREPESPIAFPGSGRLAPQAEQLRQLQQRLPLGAGSPARCVLVRLEDLPDRRNEPSCSPHCTADR